MILEKANVKYTKEGKYDYTLSSEYFEFENEEKANEYIKRNIAKNIEYYFYDKKEDIEKGLHYKVIICN